MTLGEYINHFYLFHNGYYYPKVIVNQKNPPRLTYDEVKAEFNKNKQ